MRSRLRLYCFLWIAGCLPAAAQCALNPADHTVTICQPAAGSTVGSPVHVVAGTTSSTKITGMWVYLDGTSFYHSSTNSVDTTIQAANGAHTILVKAWDSTGLVTRASVSFTVGTTTGGAPCTLSSVSPSVTICTPAAGATVSSPFRIYAGTTSSKKVTGMWAYLDNKGVTSSQTNFLDAQVSATAGSHTLRVRAWDYTGAHFDKVITFSVGGSTATSPLTFSTSSLAFPDQIVGTTSVAQRVTVTNSTASSVPISSIQIMGADFSQLQNCGVQLNPGRSCEVNVRFDPAISGARSASLQVSYTGTGSPKTVSLSGNALAQSKPPIPINHIVWIMQENRSFDGYFGKLNDYRAAQGFPTDVDGIPAAGFTNKDPGGLDVASFHYQTMCIEGTTPSWNESHYDVYTKDGSLDIGMNDGFVNQAAGFAGFNGFFDKRGVRAMGYFTEADLPYYYFMATQFATSDRFFSALPGGTPPNRLYALGGSSYGYTSSPKTTFTQRNIFQNLQEAGISWKIYYTDVDANGQPLSRIWSWWVWAQFHKDRVVPMSQYFTDLQNGTLPQVALLESGYASGRDEHPGGTVNGQPNTGTHVQVGANYVATLLNALMQSSSWKDSAFCFTFDEGGGMFDHVVPPFNAVQPDGIMPIDFTSSSVPGDFTRYGFRLPFFVASPFAKKGYVSHTPADSTAILKLIEERFGLPALTKRDAAQPDMREFFDFNNPPWLTPPTPPVQPTTGACNYTDIPE
jgi:phospholipase C